MAGEAHICVCNCTDQRLLIELTQNSKYLIGYTPRNCIVDPNAVLIQDVNDFNHCRFKLFASTEDKEYSYCTEDLTFCLSDKNYVVCLIGWTQTGQDKQLCVDVLPKEPVQACPVVETADWASVKIYSLGVVLGVCAAMLVKKLIFR